MESPSPAARASASDSDSSPVKVSPFSRYASSLSPIQLPNTKPSSAYGDLSFPSPEPLFTSPRVQHSRNQELLRRCRDLLFPPVSCMREEVNGRPSAVALEPRTITGILKYGGSGCNTLEQPCSSSSVSVDQYLADSSELCDNSTGLPEVSLKNEAEVPLQREDYSFQQKSSTLHVKLGGGGSDPFYTRVDLQRGSRQSASQRCQDTSICYERTDSEFLSLNATYCSTSFSCQAGKFPERLALIPHAAQNGDGSLKMADEKMKLIHGASYVEVLGPSFAGAATFPEGPEQETGGNSNTAMHHGCCSSIVSSENQAKGSHKDGFQNQHDKRLKTSRKQTGNKCKSKSKNMTRANLKNTAEGKSQLLSPDVHCMDGSHADPQEIPCGKQASQTATANTLVKSSGKIDMDGQIKQSSPRLSSRPSGIGLHLNSFGNTRLMQTNLNVYTVGERPRVTEDSFFSGAADPLSLQDGNCSFFTSSVGESSSLIQGSSGKLLFYPIIENGHVEHHQSEASLEVRSSFPANQLVHMRSLNMSPASEVVDYRAPINLKMHDTSEEATQVKPRAKKRKTCEDESQKTCSCKRSRCLKLYCECFASGTFCSKACACQGCSNTLNNEDIVHQARKQIESRNPLAFAPKIILLDHQPSQEGKGTSATPPSSRHKSGCSCRKSLCIRRYCECYQSGVACFAGCRCDGCANTFGRKRDCREIMENKHCQFLEKDKEIPISDGPLPGTRVKNETRRRTLLSPGTPAIQRTNRGKSRKGQCVFNLQEDSSRSSPLGASLNENRSETASTELSPVIHDLQDVVSLEESNRFDTAGEELSPVIYESDAPYQKKDPFSPKTRQVINQAKLLKVSAGLSIGFPYCHSTPVTPPMEPAERQMLIEPYSDITTHYYLNDVPPSILNDSKSPQEVVKSSSPRKKRVSPPQLPLHASGSRLSPGLRSGCKFILQHVPPLPPFSPCSNKSRGHDT